MPGPPILPSDPKFSPVVIFLAGASGIGKSTLANVLISSNVHHFDLDNLVFTISSWSKSTKCISIRSKYHHRAHLQIDKISKEIDQNCADEFVNDLLDQNSFTTPVLLVEGYTASLPRIHNALIDKFRERRYNIWSLDRQQQIT